MNNTATQALTLILCSFCITRASTELSDDNEEKFLIVDGYRPPNPMSLCKYMVSIRFTYEEIYGAGHLCGGAIIKSNAVLTAAHCLLEVEAAGIVLVVGGSRRLSEENTTKYDVRKIVVHEDYDEEVTSSDIGLVLTQKDIVLREGFVEVAKLPNQYPAAGSNCTVIGWGLLFENGPSPDMIVYVDLQIRERNFCKEFIEPECLDIYLCANNPKTKSGDSCNGDSGGPLFIGNAVVGIVSYGFGCNLEDYPGFYTNVFAFRDWIARNFCVRFSVGILLIVFVLTPVYLREFSLI